MERRLLLTALIPGMLLRPLRPRRVARVEHFDESRLLPTGALNDLDAKTVEIHELSAKLDRLQRFLEERARIGALSV